jgi:hypothetical protein
MSTQFDSNITIDLGNMSTTLDDYSIYPTTFSNIDWTTTPSHGFSASSLPQTITLSGAQGTSGYSFTSSASAGMWGSTSNNVHISHSGIDLKEGTDIKIGSRSLVKFMETLEERLAILQPDPEKLEQFAALKAAYEHYKLLEALCSGPIPKDPNSV